MNLLLKGALIVLILLIQGCGASNRNAVKGDDHMIDASTENLGVIEESDTAEVDTEIQADMEDAEIDNEIRTGYQLCPHDNPDCNDETAESESNESLNSDHESGTPDIKLVAGSDGSLDEEKSQNLLDAALDYVDASQEYWSEGNFDKAIAVLDLALANVLKVDTDLNPGLIQQKEDLRFMISKRILEIYASRYTAVSGNHEEIPLTMNKYVEREIKRFQGPMRKYFVESYRRSGKYMDMIRESLKQAGIPGELAWLPLIESGFKVRALSRARALGLWQFIPSTGYKFGLKRDRWIDERLDPKKSTLAAIEYLKELHQIFGDWTTVLAGYNCGEGTVLRRIRNQRINYLDNFWDLYEQLPRETAQYVPRFLATLHILRDPQKYGFEEDELIQDSPLMYETVEIEKPLRLKTVAKELGISSKILAELNPELRYKVTPPVTYSLKVPVGMGTELLAKLDNIPKWTPPESTYVYHRVKKGETLSLIALRYRTTVRKIVLANDLRTRHFIRTGQRLKIPLRNSQARVFAASDELLPNGKYRIKKGDSLWLIARKFKTNTKKLKKINNLKTTRLYVGQVLKIR